MAEIIQQIIVTVKRGVMHAGLVTQELRASVRRLIKQYQESESVDETVLVLCGRFYEFITKAMKNTMSAHQFFNLLHQQVDLLTEGFKTLLELRTQGEISYSSYQYEREKYNLKMRLYGECVPMRFQHALVPVKP